MEEKILNILMSMQKDISELKEDVGVLKENVSVLPKLQEDVGILKENVSGLQEDVGILKEDVSGLKGQVGGLRGDINELKEGQRIMKLNIATILEKQNEINDNFKKHEREANIRYKELDYRLSLLEA